MQLKAFDSLTKLPNRACTIDILEQCIARSSRHKTLVSAIYLSLDGFDLINERHGVDAGDNLLKSVVARIQKTLRRNDTFTRIGDTSFLIIADELKSCMDAITVAAKISRAMQSPFNILQREISVGIKLGIANFRKGAQSAEQMIVEAQAASESDSSGHQADHRSPDTLANQRAIAAKQRYDSYHSCDNYRCEADENASSETLNIERDLRCALARGELFLVYQPRVDVETRTIVSAEALLRWQHPSKGLLMPGEFIPIAEKSDLIKAIDTYVLKTVIKQLSKWTRSPLISLNLSVNVTAHSISDTNIYNLIVNMLDKYQVEPNRLELEVTERVMVSGGVQNTGIMQKLNKHGVAIAIDDFGTGYSALNYLTELPASVVKIDGSFTQGLTKNEKAGDVVGMIVELAATLEKTCVIEGVETEEQYQAIVATRCQYLQGYLFGKPMQINHFEQVVIGQKTLLSRSLH